MTLAYSEGLLNRVPIVVSSQLYLVTGWRLFWEFFIPLLFSSSARRKFTLSDLLGQSGGHRCLPLSPPVLALIIIEHRVLFSILTFQLFVILVDFHRTYSQPAIHISPNLYHRGMLFAEGGRGGGEGRAEEAAV